MLVVLAKLGSPEMVGQFALGLAVTAPVFMFANLQLGAVQATDARAEYLFGDYLGLRLITTALALLVIAGMVLVSGYRRETSLVILAVGMAKAFESVSDVLYGLLQQRERMDRIAKSVMIKGPLSLCVLAVAVYLTGSVFWGAVGLAVAWALILVGYDIRSAALILKPLPQPGGPAPDGDNPKVVLHPRWGMRTLARLAWLALPLGLVQMLVSLNSNIPRYFIEGYLGEYELGIFAAMAYLQRAGATVASALGQSASPRLAKYYAAGNGPAFRALLLKLIGIGILLGGAGVLVALIAGREILTLLYRPEYARPDVFVRLMVAVGLTYVVWFLGYGMTAARYFRVQLPVNVFVTTVAVLACIWLIPSGGLRGAATVLIIITVVKACCSTTVVVRALYALHKHVGRE
jgi:O-antigen/teichoic acid export membrane protein